jgi:hypothetical protein
MLCRDDETRAKITEKAKQRYKEIREANPEYYRDYDLRKKYGIGVAEYNEMFAAQNGVCAICKKPESRVDKRANRISNLAIDHCHTTGKVRGLLCHHCNAMLGSSLDSIENLEKGIQYLRRHLNLDPSPKIV